MINHKIDRKKIEDAMDRGGFGYYGIRIDDDAVYNVGDRTATSHDWEDTEPEDDYLNGTCCVGISYVEDIDKAIKIANTYYGDHVCLIGGDSMEYGEDEGEYIIKDAVVVAVLQ